MFKCQDREEQSVHFLSHKWLCGGHVVLMVWRLEVFEYSFDTFKLNTSVNVKLIK